MSWETLLYITVGILVLTLTIDIFYPKVFYEGFTVEASSNPFLTAYFPRRGDVSFGDEESGYVQDKRNVMGYADVQGLGVPHDFCRMVVQKGQGDDEKFFACALAGTENLSSMKFATMKVSEGLLTSRDDYMRDADKDGKTDYCAIVKMPGRGWESRCYRALTTSFDTRTFVDTEPPKDIAEVLYFYEGIIFWFRFIDDMKDYGENLKIYAAGAITIKEADVKVHPSQLMMGNKLTTSLEDRVQISNGLEFNGANQFLRLGDSADMSFGKKIALTTMRAICFWVKFDEFTNNAHIIDFGNGAGIDNVFIGIIGRGDESIDKGSEIRKDSPEKYELNQVVPGFPSGAQPVPCMTPMGLMLSTSANVDDPPCEKAVNPRKLDYLKPLQSVPEGKGGGQTATLLYEVWNGKLRLQHMKALKAIPLKKWVHVCITTASGDGVRPALQIWIDGKIYTEDPNGHLPQSSTTSNNYLGKSNWMNSSSQYENRPEMFKGSLFDLRGYNQTLNEDRIKKTIHWGKLRLGLTKPKI